MWYNVFQLYTIIEEYLLHITIRKTKIINKKLLIDFH